MVLMVLMGKKNSCYDGGAGGAHGVKYSCDHDRMGGSTLVVMNGVDGSRDGGVGRC